MLYTFFYESGNIDEVNNFANTVWWCNIRDSPNRGRCWNGATYTYHFITRGSQQMRSHTVLLARHKVDTDIC